MLTLTSTEQLHRLFIDADQKITTDTRKLEKGAIFFALKGENFDANSFVQNAIDAGCSYAVTDNTEAANGKTILYVKDVLIALQQLANYHRHFLKIPVIGITGSNGKTTNKELMHAVLAKKYNVYATKGNLNNHIGVPLTLLALTQHHEMAIVEMGANHQGEIELLCNIAEPDFGIITNIGKAHLEGFGGLEGIKKGKSELYKFIASKNGSIFINGGDEVLMELAANLPKIKYGETIDFDTHGQLFSNSEYVNFKWNTKGKSLDDCPLVSTQMFGQYNFINLLCATCVGNYFKVDASDINNALANYVPEMNRSQVIKTTHNTLILDAYNANPTSMSLAITNFINQNFKDAVLILGDMLELGIYSQEEHELILKSLERHTALKIILVGPLFYEFKDHFKNNFFFKTIHELSEYFNTHTQLNKTVLIKGSRGIKLEKLVEYL